MRSGAPTNEYADPAAEVRAIYTYHTVTEGFGDIGYQLLIDNRGQAYEGRLGREVDPDGGPGREILSRDVVAGHVFGYNYGSVGIALLGTFIEAEPTESALQTLEEALAFEAARHHLGPASQIDFLRSRKRSGDDDLWRDGLNAVSGHRDCLATECPGDRLYARLRELRGGWRPGWAHPGRKSGSCVDQRTAIPGLAIWSSAGRATQPSSSAPGSRAGGCRRSRTSSSR